MKDRQELLELLDDDMDIDYEEKSTAFFEGEEVIILDTYLRNRKKVTLIQTQTNDQLEVYSELLDELG